MAESITMYAVKQDFMSAMIGVSNMSQKTVCISGMMGVRDIPIAVRATDWQDLENIRQSELQKMHSIDAEHLGLGL